MFSYAETPFSQVLSLTLFVFGLCFWFVSVIVTTSVVFAGRMLLIGWGFHGLLLSLALRPGLIVNLGLNFYCFYMCLGLVVLGFILLGRLYLCLLLSGTTLVFVSAALLFSIFGLFRF